jgi:hypothetical protein
MNKELGWVTVIILAVIFGLGIVGIISYFNNATPPETQQNGYYLEQGDFSVYFPAKPTYSLKTQDLTKGNSKSVNNYTWRPNVNNPSGVLVATYVSTAFTGSNRSAEENLRNEVEYTGNTNGFTLISMNPTTYQGLFAIDYVISNQRDTSQPALYTSGRDIVRGNDLYMLEYGYYSGQEDKKLEDTFLNSLKFGAPVYAVASPLATSSQPQQNTQTTYQSSQDSSPTVTGKLTPSLINQIEPAVVEINCYAADNSFRVMGSGTSIKNNGVIEIVSNYHVYAEAIVGNVMPTCYAVYPEPPNFSFNDVYGDYQITLVANTYNPNTYQDSALFKLGALLPASAGLNPIPTMTDVSVLGLYQGCTDVQVGDSVTIFGYPNSGNFLGISETVTHGIISGIVTGPIFKTDAPIDRGNSGGLAVLDKNKCVIGIPTLGVSGLTSGIGYIQSYQFAY